MKIPIFPLNGAVLFPGTSLPLNIFEKRYIEMVDYALSKERFIGMIQSNEKNNLYNIGCIGKIHSFSETTDGRYLISLQGTNCFKVKKELEKKHKFRLIEAEMLEFDEDNNFVNEKQKNTLLEKYSQYIRLKKINLNLEEIQKIDFNQIIKFIAMISPFGDIEKQALLETKNLNDFYKKLKSILELEILEDNNNTTIN
tara:strand:+ start:669 stop:1262 length:594 start_codon:yes stop_codon:yes gene_type:complete